MNITWFMQRIILVCRYYVSKKIIREILRYPEGKEAVKQNVDLMLDTISPEHVFEDIQLIKGLSQQTDQKLNKYIEAHKEAFIYSMAVKNTRNRYESL